MEEDGLSLNFVLALPLPHSFSSSRSYHDNKCDDNSNNNDDDDDDGDDDDDDDNNNNNNDDNYNSISSNTIVSGYLEHSGGTGQSS